MSNWPTSVSLHDVDVALGDPLRLYRHFPLRSDLINAVFRREVDPCAAEAPKLAATHDPAEALELWIQHYARFIVTKRGLAVAPNGRLGRE